MSSKVQSQNFVKKFNAKLMRGWPLKLGILIIAALVALPVSAQVAYEPNAPISANRAKALLLFQRLTGQKISVDSQIIRDIEAQLNAGRPLDAAALLTDRPAFYNNTLRMFAQKMTTPDDSYKAPFSDMSAHVLGVTKDNLDARLLLTSNYLYRISDAPVANADLYTGNNHYATVQTRIENNPDLDLRPLLVQARQQVLDNNNAVVNHPEPAGMLTSRAFSLMGSSAGTARRNYLYTMDKFMCITLEAIADTSAPDGRVGRDVSRAPGGDPNAFQQTCRGCHGNMDGMRSAFAYLEFDANAIKHGQAFANNNLFDAATRVAVKLNRVPPGMTPIGFTVRDNTWENNLITGARGEFFGWRNDAGQIASQTISGAGIPQYARMVANSVAFSNCLVKRAYGTVCRREASPMEAGAIRTIASEFEDPARGNRRIKWLFERVATDSSCIGQ